MPSPSSDRDRAHAQGPPLPPPGPDGYSDHSDHHISVDELTVRSWPSAPCSCGVKSHAEC